MTASASRWIASTTAKAQSDSLIATLSDGALEPLKYSKGHDAIPPNL